jgi:cysteinyl-tRNA synthetase
MARVVDKLTQRSQFDRTDKDMIKKIKIKGQLYATDGERVYVKVEDLKGYGKPRKDEKKYRWKDISRVSKWDPIGMPPYHTMIKRFEKYFYK